MRSLQILLAICILTSPLVAADIVTVQGTANVTIDGELYLNQIGFDAEQGGTVEFSYSYELTGDDESTTPGFFKFMSFDANHNLIDSLDFNPYPIGVAVQNDRVINPNRTIDHYGAGIIYTDQPSGLSVLVVMHLVDEDALALPGDPATYLSLANDWEEADIGIGIDIDHIGEYYTSLVAELTSLSAVVTVDPDPDGDGVLNADDQCSGTPNGHPVNADGCSIDQLVPCGGPMSGGTWRNHGQYQNEVVRIANEFFAQGLITDAERRAIIAGAAQSGCGR